MMNDNEIRFCINCGDKLPIGAKFCSKCGAKVDFSDPENKEIGNIHQKNCDGINKGVKQISIKKIVLFVVIIACVVGLFLYKTKSNKDSYIAIVKEGRLQAYSEITIGEAFENFFEESSWDYFEGETAQSKKKSDIVEFRGKCIYTGEEKEIQFQFSVQEEDFYIVYLALDGVPQEETVLNEILGLVYRVPMDIDDIHSYAQVNGVTILCPHTLVIERGADYYTRMKDENGKYLTYGQIADGAYEKIYNIEGREGILNAIGDVVFARGEKDIPTEFYEKYTENSEYIEEFVGDWQDSYSQRANMVIEYTEDSKFHIIINWSSSAWENTRWVLEGYYNEEEDGIVYTGAQISEVYNDDGSVMENYIYTDGEGLIYIGRNGKLYWDDWKENVGNECVFEKAGVIEVGSSTLVNSNGFVDNLEEASKMYYITELVNGNDVSARVLYAYLEKAYGNMYVKVVCDITNISGRNISFDTAKYFELSNNGILKSGYCDYDYAQLTAGASFRTVISFTYPENANNQLGSMALFVEGKKISMFNNPQTYEELGGIYYRENGESISIVHLYDNVYAWISYMSSGDKIYYEEFVLSSDNILSREKNVMYITSVYSWSPEAYTITHTYTYEVFGEIWCEETIYRK